jgi:cytochrome c-type biogenesis protein
MDLGPGAQELIRSTNLPLLAAFLVGLVAAVGPCPIATNIAALSYTAQQFSHRGAVLAAAALYTVGRATGYTVVGVLVLAAGARIGRVASGLQDAGDVLLGPFLILAGLVLLDVIHLRAVNPSAAWLRTQQRIAQWRGGGAFVLGFLFALAFCPYSATLFFGVLIPLAMRTSYGVALPVAFGIGTAMPVLVFGVPLALGIERAAVGLNQLGRVEKIVRKVAGWLFIGAGLYSLSRLFDKWLP